MINNEAHYDYSGNSIIYTIIRNHPHFVIGVLIMIGLFGFYYWKFPI